MEKDGRLKVGQRILEINGTSLLGATHIVAVRALRSNPMEVSLLVCDGYDPREVVRREKEQERLSIGSNASATLDTSSLSSEGEHLVHSQCCRHSHCSPPHVPTPKVQFLCASANKTKTKGTHSKLPEKGGSKSTKPEPHHVNQKCVFT